MPHPEDVTEPRLCCTPVSQLDIDGAQNGGSRFSFIRRERVCREELHGVEIPPIRKPSGDCDRRISLFHAYLGQDKGMSKGVNNKTQDLMRRCPLIHLPLHVTALRYLLQTRNSLQPHSASTASNAHRFMHGGNQIISMSLPSFMGVVS